MHLYCMRHGEAERIDVNPHQPLTSQGQHDISAIAAFLKQKRFSIEHIVHSGKQRAWQTADIIKRTFCTAQVSEAHHLRVEQPEVDLIRSWLFELENDTLLVGHLPLMDYLVQLLIFGQIHQATFIHYQPGTLVRLRSFSYHHWMLDWVIHPYIINSV